jgi:hypothetical protein
MNKSKLKPYKKYILIIIAIIFVILLFVCIKKCTSNNKDDGLKYNTNKSFIKEQKKDGIVFKNIKCTYNGEYSDISYTMVNETKDTIYLNNYDIIVKDKDKKRLTKIAAHINEKLVPNKSLDWVDRVVGIDLTDAYYMELKLNTEKKDKK